MPTQTPVRTDAPVRPAPATRPYIDPAEVREPGKHCGQQKRELGWEGV